MNCEKVTINCNYFVPITECGNFILLNDEIHMLDGGDYITHPCVIIAADDAVIHRSRMTNWMGPTKAGYIRRTDVIGYVDLSGLTAMQIKEIQTAIDSKNEPGYYFSEEEK